MFQRTLIFCLIVMLPSLAQSQPLRIAVASNFAVPLARLIDQYQQASPAGADISVSIGSTGKLYAQITRGAPFDLFFAADTERPQRLVRAGLTAGPEKIYTVGRLALYHPKSKTAGGLETQLNNSPRIAMANPKLAPYGLAAQQTLQALNWQPAPSNLILTLENVGQTWASVASGNAAAGFVSLSQLQQQGAAASAFTLVPTSLHDPIAQAAVVLQSSHALAEAKAFLAFVRQQSGTSASGAALDPAILQSVNGP